MIRLLNFFCLMALIVFIYSCDIINPEEEIPSFIEFSGFDLIVRGGEGSNSHQITEGWIYVDNELIGAFSPNKPFPVLASGESEIVVDPGIHTNGISVATELYPFYTRFTTTVNLVEGETTIIRPQFEYRENLTFVFVQDFTDTHIFTDDLDNNTNTEMTTTLDGAFEGPSGIISLDQDNPVSAVGTAFNYELPNTSLGAVLMEINYKTDARLNIGIIGFNDFGTPEVFPPTHGLNIKEEWNKVYIDFSEALNSSGYPSHQIYFSATIPEDVDNANILFDNIKLIHFDQ